MSTLIHQRVEAARRGENPTVISKMPSGWAVPGDRQFIQGYSLLLPDPVVADINDLKGKARLQFLNDMTVLGDALLEVTDAFRINYSILGNADPALHVHIHPRYMREPEKQRRGPTYLTYSQAELNSRPFDEGRDKAFMDKLATVVKKLEVVL